MNKVIILGAGLIGGPISIDLSKSEEFDVSVADINPAALEKFAGFKIKIVQKDLSDPDVVMNLVKDYDFVLSAVPGFMGYKTLEAVIKAKKNVVDIAFFPEEPFSLNTLAQKMDITAIADCGVAPGMSNILTSYAYHRLDITMNAITYVGGLPEIREYPFEYKAVFSPVDVIEEYTRPARYIENKMMVTRPALSDPELMNFPGIGTLEAFNSDGMRSLGTTLSAVNIKEKTLRYPGHINIMRVLRDTGFFSKEEIEIKGVKISPLEFTAKLMFPIWEMKKGDRDLTVMKIIVEGTKNGEKIRYTYDLLDRFDEANGTHSMARTTGYTATAALRMMSDGLYNRKGLIVPEYIGENSECVEYMLAKLAERGVVYIETIENY